MPPRRNKTPRPARGRTRPGRAPALSPPSSPPPPPPRPAPETLDLQPAPAPLPGNIPWGYAENRITAMARDPHWIFVYWEVTDEGLEDARRRAGAPQAGCTLRVYETTYRIFDGLNANFFWDIPVDRAANNHYIPVHRPASVFHVDIGVRGPDGRFAPIARSGAVETPRDSVSPDGRVEWMTVPPEGHYRPYRHRYTPRPPAAPAAAGGPEAFGISAGDLERFLGALRGEGWVRTEWTVLEMGGRVVRWVRWEGPFRGEQWAWALAGPGTFARVEIALEAERRVVRLERGERVLYGPWRVTLYGLDPHGGRRVMDRWALRTSWLTEEGSVRVFTDVLALRILQGYRAWVIPAGASEAFLLREAWSSEVLLRGASEWRWLGGSEIWLAGASETLFRGASERFFLGASETLWMGASETLWAGASERLFLGASGWAGGSEVLLRGASEALFPAASEGRLGGAGGEGPAGGAPGSGGTP